MRCNGKNGTIQGSKVISLHYRLKSGINNMHIMKRNTGSLNLHWLHWLLPAEAMIQPHGGCKSTLYELTLEQAVCHFCFTRSLEHIAMYLRNVTIQCIIQKKTLLTLNLWSP